MEEIIEHIKTHTAYNDLLGYFQGIDLMKKLEGERKYKFEHFESRYFDGDLNECHKYFNMKYQLEWTNSNQLSVMSTHDGYHIQANMNTKDAVKNAHNFRSILKGEKIKYSCAIKGDNFISYSFSIKKENFTMKQFTFISKFFLKYMN